VRNSEPGNLALWLVRIVWIALPITAGPAAASALEDWSGGPQLVAGVFLWGSWAVAVVALIAPRPLGLTALRVIAPAFVVAAAAAGLSGAPSVSSAGAALASTIVAAALIALPAVSTAAANGVAYGDERRFPLKTPPVLLVGPLPLASLLVAAGATAGPLLIAADRPVPGALALVAGLPLAAFMARALHGLSRRWIVLVPAGLVIADPLALPDPVLFLRERIVALRAIDGGTAAPSGAIDLRLGALADSVALTLDQETEFLYIRRGKRGAVPARGNEVRVAALRRRELLAGAAERRIRVAAGD
jgi:hypothetical protein